MQPGGRADGRFGNPLSSTMTISGLSDKMEALEKREEGFLKERPSSSLSQDGPSRGGNFQPMVQATRRRRA